MMRKIIFATSSLLILLLVGCGTTAKFIYPAKGQNLIRFSDGPAYQKKVAVTPFEEMRGDENQAGTYFLYLIPLMPFGYAEYERPEAARMFLSIAEFDFDASEDLAKAAAYSLRKSGLFKDAFFTFGGDKDKADFLLEGKTLSTTYKGTLWTYGLSVYGPLLWFIGLPAGTSQNDLSLVLKMTDLQKGKLVWEKKYEMKQKIVQWLYYKMGHDAKGYAYLMQEIMNDAVEDINREFQKRGMK
jgi:hypothetical protein